VPVHRHVGKVRYFGGNFGQTNPIISSLYGGGAGRIRYRRCCRTFLRPAIRYWWNWISPELRLHASCGY
jgi:hypothetical protein